MRILDREKRYWPPDGHEAISTTDFRMKQGLDDEPDVVLGKNVWAMIEKGTFTARLPAEHAEDPH